MEDKTIKILLIKYFIFSCIMIFFLFISGQMVIHVSSQKVLGKYYIDCTNIAKNWSGLFDEDGIPLTDYKEFGIQYQPVGIAQYALGTWDLYLENNDPQDKEKFIHMADWFCDNLLVENDFGVWEYKFDFPRYNLKAPWPSAMSQGEGISVLMRAYQLTENKKYIEIAKLALNSFRVPIEMGGVLYKDKEGYVWYEEYPSLEKEPPHVLNGFIFALFGLYDYYKATESEEALELFNQGIKTLKEKINLWDMGFWSRYDLISLYNKENTYIFHFVTDKKHPDYPHPIDKIILNEISDTGKQYDKIILDLGTNNDISDVSINGSHLYFSPEYQDWGKSYRLDGRTVRNYENLKGQYQHAPFQFLISCKPSCKYYLEITYKDITREPVYLEMYAKGVKYIRLDKLECINDGMWKTVQVPSNLFILKEAATTNYHKLHIEQLNILYKITKEDIFNVYAQTFEKYYKSHSLKSIWQNIINEIKQKGRIE